MRRRTVSLASEVQLLSAAIRGARALTDPLESPGSQPRVLVEVDAILTVVVERMRLVDRVLRGAVDPAALWCDANDGESVRNGDGDENERRLVAWSDQRLARFHREERRRAKRRIRSR